MVGNSLDFAGMSWAMANLLLVFPAVTARIAAASDAIAFSSPLPTLLICASGYADRARFLRASSRARR